jgi:hypothetical protein
LKDTKRELIGWVGGEPESEELVRFGFGDVIINDFKLFKP